MSITDWIALGTLVVTAATGGVIYWYTLETHQMRLEMKRQNDLTLARDRLLVVPIIRWRTNNTNPFAIPVTLTNQGYKCGTVTAKATENIAVVPDCWSVWDKNDEINFTFSSQEFIGLTQPFTFSISYVTALGESWTTSFECRPVNGMIKELKTERNV